MSLCSQRSAVWPPPVDAVAQDHGHGRVDGHLAHMELLHVLAREGRDAGKVEEAGVRAAPDVDRPEDVVRVVRIDVGVDHDDELA